MALLPVLYYNHNLLHFIYKGLKHNYNTSVFCFIQLHVTRGNKCSIVQLLVITCEFLIFQLQSKILI